MRLLTRSLVPFMTALALAAGCSSATSDQADDDHADDDSSGDDGDDDSMDKDGPDAASEADLFPNGLSCETYSLCTTYKADPSRVPFPDAPGGTLEDGLYRAVQGTSIPYGLAIHDGKYSLVFENLSVAHGDIEVLEPGKVKWTHTTSCAPAIFNDNPALTMSYESYYFADGDTLYTYSGCDSLDPENCGSPTKLVRVSSLCDDLDALSCDGGECNCATFDDGEIPERPAGGTCEF
jgi:hypothetical protein